MATDDSGAQPETASARAVRPTRIAVARRGAVPALMSPPMIVLPSLCAHPGRSPRWRAYAGAVTETFDERTVRAVLRHMNSDHADDNLLIARAFGDRPRRRAP